MAKKILVLTLAVIVGLVLTLAMIWPDIHVRDNVTLELNVTNGDIVVIKVHEVLYKTWKIELFSWEERGELLPLCTPHYQVDLVFR